jgi:hypothetical protein
VFRLFLLLALALVLLSLFHLVMEPAPIPSLSAVTSGLLACAFRANWRWLGCSILLGLLAGACVHAYSHFAEGRAESVSQMCRHVGADAALGLAGAIVVLGIVLIVDRLLFPDKGGRMRANASEKEVR